MTKLVPTFPIVNLYRLRKLDLTLAKLENDVFIKKPSRIEKKLLIVFLICESLIKNVFVCYLRILVLYPAPNAPKSVVNALHPS